MPTQVISIDEARLNVRKSSNVQWGKSPEPGSPGYDAGHACARIHQSELPVWLPSAQEMIQPRGEFFAMGSCFAREIEEAFLRRGFTANSRPPARMAQGHSEHALTNRYNTATMLLEFQRLLLGEQVVPDSALLIQEGENQFSDAHYHPMVTCSIEELVDRRRRFYESFQRLRSADFVVITLGLIEAAFDLDSGLYRNATPTMREIRRRKNLEVHCLSFQDNMTNLDRIRSLIREHCHKNPPLFVTVSPVPLTLTYKMEDVVIANSASKATLRAVANEFCASYSDVTYFPSYDIATNADPKIVYAADRRHIRKGFVEHIIGQFDKNFCVKADEPVQVKTADQ